MLEKQQEQKDLRERLEQLKSQNVAAWEEERASLVELCKRREKVLEQLKLNERPRQSRLARMRDRHLIQAAMGFCQTRNETIRLSQSLTQNFRSC